MARIIFARHGETDWNKASRVQGALSDVPLNDYGREQAHRAGDYLAGETFAAVYSSPLSRAAETARIINEGHNLPIITNHSLVEINAGDYEGVCTSELDRRFSQIVAKQDKDACMYRVPGGESLAHVQERGWQVVEEILAEHNGETVLVVTHYFVILSIICRVLDLPLVNITRFYMATGAISIINMECPIPRLEAFNILP